MVLAAGLLPNWGAAIAQFLQGKMLEWLRCAEFSCDRAALLATQNPEVVMSVLMKLAGGSPTLALQLNLDAFIEQARDYQDISDTFSGEMLKTAQTEQSTHPTPVLRARELDLWASSREYYQLLETRKTQYNQKYDFKGGWRNW